MDASAFEDDLHQVLAALHNLIEGGQPWVSSADISRHLRDQFGLQIHWRTIDKLLAGERGQAARRKRQRRWEYMILEEGRAAIAGADEAITFVNPATALQETLKLHDLLARLKGTIRVCDPYLDDSTVEHLEACSKGTPIRLLTMNVKDTGPLRRVVAAAKTSGYQLDIRVVTSRTLHDRYLIDDADMIILGTSLNGFGKKQSFVIQAGPDIRQTVLVEFDQQWNAAAAWP